MNWPAHDTRKKAPVIRPNEYAFGIEGRACRPVRRWSLTTALPFPWRTCIVRSPDFPFRVIMSHTVCSGVQNRRWPGRLYRRDRGKATLERGAIRSTGYPRRPCRSGAGRLVDRAARHRDEVEVRAVRDSEADDGDRVQRFSLRVCDYGRTAWSAWREVLLIPSSPVWARPRATSRSFRFRFWEERRKRSKASSGVISSRSIKIPLAWPMTSRDSNACCRSRLRL